MSEQTIPEGWYVTTQLPKGKYIVVETEDGWDVYTFEDGSFS